MNCIVCGNPVTVEGSNVCGFACLMKTRLGEMPGWDSRRPRKVGKAGGVSQLVQKVDSMRRSSTPQEQEVPMLRIKHPSIKGRNVVVGSTVFSFNNEGIATVKKLGSVMEDFETLCRQPGSRFELIPDEPEKDQTVATPTPAPEPVVAVPVVPPEEKLPVEAPSVPEEPVALPDGTVRKPVVKTRRRIDKE